MQRVTTELGCDFYGFDIEGHGLSVSPTADLPMYMSRGLASIIEDARRMLGKVGFRERKGVRWLRARIGVQVAGAHVMW